MDKEKLWCNPYQYHFVWNFMESNSIFGYLKKKLIVIGLLFIGMDWINFTNVFIGIDLKILMA